MGTKNSDEHLATKNGDNKWRRKMATQNWRQKWRQQLATIFRQLFLSSKRLGGEVLRQLLVLATHENTTTKNKHGNSYYKKSVTFLCRLQNQSADTLTKPIPMHAYCCYSCSCSCFCLAASAAATAAASSCCCQQLPLLLQQQQQQQQ